MLERVKRKRQEEEERKTQETGSFDNELKYREVCVLPISLIELSKTKMMTCNMAAVQQNSIDDDRLYLSNGRCLQQMWRHVYLVSWLQVMKNMTNRVSAN